MKVVSGSHKMGRFVHKKNTAKNLVLDQEVSFDQLDETKIVSLNLKAGQISFIMMPFYMDRKQIILIEEDAALL